ncbi:hypothetical protein AAVH_08235, partial [Aphelenchoides avenae]
MLLRTVLKPPIEACFVLFHVSVLYCIIVEKSRRNIRLSGAFFTLYFLQSTFDIVLVLTYGISRGFSDLGILVPLLNIWLALGTYAQLAQGIAHALISYNRFTATVRPHEHKETWEKRKTAYACVLAILLPLPALAIKWQVQYRIEANPSTGSYNITYAIDVFSTLSGFMVFAYCTASALTSAVFELTTFIVYYRLSRANQLTYREDYKLLLYAASQFLGQLLATFCTSSLIIRAFVDVPYFQAVIPFVYLFAVDILGFSGPMCLLLT